MACSFPARPLGRALCLLAVWLLAACQDLPTTQRAGWYGHPLVAYDVRGTGAPTVVLQAGLGDGKAVWSDVFDALAADGRTLAYDRPGYGDSAAVDDPRDPCTIATEERNFLRSAGIAPPYVLVGHSLGGLYQFVYAKMYPDEVAGLVLLDPTHPRQWLDMQKDMPTLATTIHAIVTVSLSSTVRREFDAQSECLGLLDLTHPSAIPVRLLASGRREALETGDFTALLERQREDWLRLTGAPNVELMPQSGHYLQHDVPLAVIAAVHDVRERARPRVPPH